MKPKNLPEAKALIERYRSITEDEIKYFRENPLVTMHDIKKELTGFGFHETCTLCKVDCDKCIYFDGIFKNTLHCVAGENRITYIAIQNAYTTEELLKAYKDRADHVEQLIKKFE